MKKKLFTIALLLAGYCCHAQNSFPTTGNVGIGTSSPTAPLNVSGGGTATSISNVSTTSTTLINTANPSVSLGIGYVSSDNPMIQAFNITSGASNHLIINPFGGNVGIGTVSPTYKLSIVNAAGTAPMGIQTGAGGVWSIGQNSGVGSGDDTFGIYSYTFGPTHGSYPLIQFNGSNGNTILNVGGGNIGVGTTSPLAKLHNVGTFVTAGSAANIDGVNLNFLANTGDLLVGWNRSSGSGEADFISNQAGGVGGGFAFYNHNNSNTETQLMFIQGNGNVGIGISDPGSYKLAVNGTIHSKSVVVDLVAWPDYVFKKDYQLPSLIKVKSYIDKNQHLPDMPSEQEVAKDGIDLGEMNKLLVKKVEELTLYLIQQKEEMDKRNNIQQQQIDKLKSQMAKLINQK